jgi:hypothetical protein
LEEAEIQAVFALKGHGFTSYGKTDSRTLHAMNILVAAPAFMRGKERFSAPGRGYFSITRFNAGNRKTRG